MRLLCERALAIHEKTLSPDHPGTATTINSPACILSQTGHIEAAEDLFKRAIAVGERVLGQEHLVTQR
jgi:Tetratricopeptide repeat